MQLTPRIIASFLRTCAYNFNMVSGHLLKVQLRRHAPTTHSKKAANSCSLSDYIFEKYLLQPYIWSATSVALIDLGSL